MEPRGANGGEYGAFVQKGEPDWHFMEDLLNRVRRNGLSGLDLDDVEHLAASHRRVVSDFAFARTRFRGTAAERRLRHLAFSGHRLLSRVDDPWLQRGLRFLWREYPTAFRESLPTTGAALALFCVATVAGLVTTTINVDIAAMFVGPDAVDAMRHGTIWTDEVSGVAPASLLSSSIFTNNISVAMLAWAGGVLLGVGSLYVLLFNGLMFGSVLGLAWRFDLLDRLFAFISTHGPLELFLIIVSGAAGLELARGVVSDDNLPRRVTMARAGRRSVRLVGGAIPWLVLLGVVEGNISPQMWVPTPLKMLIGAILLAAFLLYALRPTPGRTA